MKKSNKHYKFINSKTGNAIYYCSLDNDLNPEKVKEELEKVQAKVAIQNGIFVETLFWEEIKD
jgi:hypothetical protein